MPACISGVDSRHHKMLHAYTTSVLHCLDAHADVPVSDITIACYGAALQTHLSHVIMLLGPNLSWELWRGSGEFAPLFDTHLSQKVAKRTGTVDEYLRDIGARGGRRFICLVDLDLHVPAHVLRSRNERGIKPTVESENLFYNSVTRQYADICKRAATTKHVLVVSIPFRAPWPTDDFEAKQRHATWLTKDARMVYPRLYTFRQYNTRPRSTEVRGLCWCSGADAEHETVDWKQIDADMREYNGRRVCRDYDILKEFLGHYEQCGARRRDLFENESDLNRAWRSEFVGNSLAYALETEAHAAEAAAAAPPAKSVRFADSV
jgi:hypothetical protein